MMVSGIWLHLGFGLNQLFEFVLKGKDKLAIIFGVALNPSDQYFIGHNFVEKGEHECRNICWDCYCNCECVKYCVECGCFCPYE